MGKQKSQQAADGLVTEITTMNTDKNPTLNFYGFTNGAIRLLIELSKKGINV
jgi:hypothetical protein